MPTHCHDQSLTEHPQQGPLAYPHTLPVFEIQLRAGNQLIYAALLPLGELTQGRWAGEISSRPSSHT
jgi:hypothetical protein